MTTPAPRRTAERVLDPIAALQSVVNGSEEADSMTTRRAYHGNYHDDGDYASLIRPAERHPSAPITPAIAGGGETLESFGAVK